MTEDQRPGSGATAARRAAVAIVAFLALAALVLVFDPGNSYLWLKAIHVIAVIAWMAGMLYLPRLFVYHADSPPGSPQSELLKVMERRLLRIIVNPAMIVTWAFGLYLAWDGFQLSGTWLHLKIALVIGLSALHGYFSAAVRRFAEDRNDKPARHWRIMNEATAVLMIAIVILVIVKPF